MEGRSTCLNCGTALTARWCPVCGQDGERRLHSLPTVLARTLESVVDFDGRVASTLRRLVAHPGRLTREYAQGHFVGQVDPMRRYLATSALYFFLAPRIGGGFIRLAGGDASGPWFSFGPLGWDSAFLLLILVPLWALMARLIIPGRSRYVEEFFVFSVHYQIVFFLVVGGTGILFLLHLGGAQLLQNTM